MSVLLLDASVWLAALDTDDESHEPAAGLVARGDRAALDLTRYEVANVAVVRWKDPSAGARLLQLIEARCRGRVVAGDTDRVEEALRVADELTLTVYDAAYVAAARRYAWDLVSSDVRHLVDPGHAMSPAAAIAT